MNENEIDFEWIQSETIFHGVLVGGRHEFECEMNRVKEREKLLIE